MGAALWVGPTVAGPGVLVSRSLCFVASTLLAAGCVRHTAPVSQVTAGTTAQTDPLQDDLAQMWAWFPGEYANHEQVLEQKYSEAEVYDQLHQIFLPVAIPELGEHVLFVQQHKVGNPEPYRVRVYTLQVDTEREAVRLDIYKPVELGSLTNLHLEPERAQGLDAAATLSLAEGCSVWWTRSDDGFVGSTDDGTCQIPSRRTGEPLVFSDTLRLTSEQLHIQDVARRPDGTVVFGHPDGEPHRLRKLSWYSGWSVVRRGGPDYDRENPEWRVHKGLHLHSEGGRTPLVDASGDALPYAVELARLTRAGSNTHLLKVSLIELESGKSVAYAWTDPTASRIGLNLGWAQVGLTRETLTPHLGFDSNEESSLVRTLAERLTGTLTSAAQAERDPEYRTIQLQSCPVDAPGLGATVLYVEQAVGTALDKPYRQRLYLLEEVDAQTVRSSIFTLADPEAAIGLCGRSERSSFHPSEASLREGCEVDMAFDGSTFRGETAPEACPSSLRGATHASVAVTVTTEGLDSWDRGWDAAGQQVWGAEKGAYEFRRPLVAPAAD